MKKTSLSAQLRQEIGSKEAVQLRKANKVPAVLYGGEKQVHFSVDEIPFTKLINTADVFEVELDVEGTTYRSVMKDVQYHPVSDRPIHIDFVELFDDREVLVKLPIQLTGASEGVRAGGKLSQLMRHVSVKGLPGNLPDGVEVDITPLEIGDSVRIGDLSLDKITVFDADSAVVVAVKTSRKAMSDAALDEEGAEGAEGEDAAEGEAAAE